MVDAGTFEYWQAGEQTPAPSLGQDSGTMEFWQADEQPPILSGSDEEIGVAPMRGWGWGFVGVG